MKQSKTTVIADSNFQQGYAWAARNPHKVCPKLKEHQHTAECGPAHLQEFSAGILAWYDEYTSQFIQEVRIL